MSKSSISQDLADLRAQMQSFRRVLDNTSQNISRITNKGDQNSSSSLKLSTSFSPVHTNKSKTNDTYTYETTQRIFQTLKFSAVSSSSDSDDEKYGDRKSDFGEKRQSMMRVSEIISDDELNTHQNDSDDEGNFINPPASRSKKVTIVDPSQRKTPKTGASRKRTVVDDLEDIISPTVFQQKGANNHQQYNRSRNNYINQISPITSGMRRKNADLDMASPMRGSEYTPNTRTRPRHKKTPKKSIRDFLLASTSSSGSDMDDDSSDGFYIPKKGKQNASKLPFFSITADDEILIRNPNTNTRIARLSKSLLEQQEKDQTEAQLENTENEKGKNPNASMEVTDPVVVFSSSTKDPLSGLSLYSSIYNDLTPSQSRSRYQRRDIPEYKNRTPVQRKSSFSSRYNNEDDEINKQQSDRPLVTNKDISQIFRNLPVIVQTDSESDDDEFSFKPPVADSIPNIDYLQQLQDILKEDEDSKEEETKKVENENEKAQEDKFDEKAKEQPVMPEKVETENQTQKAELEDKETLTEIYDTKSIIVNETQDEVSHRGEESVHNGDTVIPAEELLSKVKKLDLIFTSDEESKVQENEQEQNAKPDEILDIKEVNDDIQNQVSSHEEDIIEIEEIKESNHDKEMKPEENVVYEERKISSEKEFDEKSVSSDDDYNDNSDDETEVKLQDLTQTINKENETSVIPKNQDQASTLSPKQNHTTTEIQDDINFDSVSSALDEDEQQKEEKEPPKSQSRIHNSSYITESEIEEQIKNKTQEHLQKLNSSIKEPTFISSSEEPIHNGDISDGAALDAMMKELQALESPDDLKSIDGLLSDLQKEIQK